MNDQPDAPQEGKEVAVSSRRSILAEMAGRYQMSSALFEETLRATVMPSGASKEDLLAFLAVARQYDLNPFTREIYAFPGKGGGIQVIVGVDGWAKLVNINPAYDGMTFAENKDAEKRLESVTCTIWRKDRSHPTVITEYLAECIRSTEPWKQLPHRMLRHRALIQCARIAFGFAGIMDPDDAERMIDISPKHNGNGNGINNKIDALIKKPVKPASETIDPETGEVIAAPASAKPAQARAAADAGAPAVSPASQQEAPAGATTAAVAPSPAAAPVEAASGPPGASAGKLTPEQAKHIRKFAEGLMGAMSARSVNKASVNFLEDAAWPEGGAAEAAVVAIRDIHLQRVAGKSSPAECDTVRDKVTTL